MPKNVSSSKYPGVTPKSGSTATKMYDPKNSESGGAKGASGTTIAKKYGTPKNTE
jgi:hypothetical protein